jgi:HAD superfamily hydrolase (TIGR01549 family)
MTIAAAPDAVPPAVVGTFPPTRAVLFDVDGTLYRQRPLRACMAAELAATALRPSLTGRTIRAARILRGYRHAQEDLRARAIQDKGLARLQIAEAARRAHVPERDVDAAVTEWMRIRPLKYLSWCRRPQLRRLLVDLHAQGILLGVLSDYPAADKLAALGVADLISLVLCGTDPEIGSFKPHPRGFRRACEIWNLAPEQVLYVGDRTDVDGEGAAGAGLRSVVIGDHGAGSADGARYLAVRRLGELRPLVC